MSFILFDQDGRGVTDGLNLQQFIDKMFALDPWNKSADWLVLPVRCSLLLRGMGLMLNHPVSVCASWKKAASKVIAKDKVTL